jgi:Uma2 family endonuclease
MNPAPSTYHQTVSRRLQFQLYTQIELAGLGQVFNAPVDLQLSDYDIIQPDIVVVLHRTVNIITPSKIKGVPDLIIEILSPSTTRNDCVLKKELYQRSGVQEYWIADPMETQLEQLVLESGVYRSVEKSTLIRLSILPSVTVDLEKVW